MMPVLQLKSLVRLCVHPPDHNLMSSSFETIKHYQTCLKDISELSAQIIGKSFVLHTQVQCMTK